MLFYSDEVSINRHANPVKDCISPQLRCISEESIKGRVKYVCSCSKLSLDYLIIKTLSDLHFYRFIAI